MGCWFKTCGLTQMHIYGGEPVYVFLLKKPKYKNVSYSNFLYDPLLFPFDSIYDEYGGGKQSTGIAFELIIKHLKECLVEMPLGENEYHDIEVKRDAFDEDLFFNSIKEDRLFINTKHDENIPVNFVMMKKNAVDKILEDYVIDDYRQKVKYADIINDLDSYIETKLQRIQQSNGYFYDPFIENNLVYDYFDGIMYSVSFFSSFDPIDFRNLVRTYLTEGKIEEAKEIMKRVIMGVVINIFMGSIRKCWHPGGFEGSQSSDLDSYKLLIDTMNENMVIEEYECEQMSEEEVFKLAENPNTSQRILDELADDTSPTIRGAVARHNNTSQETLRRLSDDVDSYVRNYAKANPNFLKEESST